MQCMKIDIFYYIEQNTFFKYSILDFFYSGFGVIWWEYDLPQRTVSFSVWGGAP